MEIEAAASRDKSSLVFGTIFSVPIFVVCFLVTSVVTHVVYLFFSSVHGGEPNRLVELSAAGISSAVGVYAGRWLCDKVLKDWSGWPIFLLLIALAALNGIAIMAGYGDPDWWRNALLMLQLIVAAGVAWPMVVKKQDL